MLIPVIYPNGTHDLVKDFYLDYLIRTEKIDKFKRSNGWVQITATDVRGKHERNYYSGTERRIQQQNDEIDETNKPLIIEFLPVNSFFAE